MDYEKMYKEALERAIKYNIDDVYACQGTVVKLIFPQLAESEDERIRRELLEAVAYIIPNEDEVDEEGGVLPTYIDRIDRYKAWLEKQKEQKPYEPKNWPADKDNLTQEQKPWKVGANAYFTPEQKPAEWSEEDEKKRQRIIKVLEAADSDWVLQKAYGPYGDLINWLKSLRPSWKPSEEQMNRLFSIVAALRKDYCDDMADFLASIYEQLKNL